MLKAPDKRGEFNRLLSVLEVGGYARPDASLALALPLPGKDQPVLLGAIRLECQILLTGDRTHFGELYGKSLGSVLSDSPRSLAERLLVAGGGDRRQRAQ